MIKILTALHTLPEIKTYRTIFFEKIIPVLKEKFDVQVYWLVYTPEKLSNSIKEKNDRILDIHDFQNAVEVIEKVKPDIIISAPTLNLPDFALTLAAKFYNIPTAGEVVTKLFVVENTKITLFSFFKGFFSSSVPTDNNEKNKKFMRRGIFFIYKYYFLLKTQKIIKMKYKMIFKMDMDECIREGFFDEYKTTGDVLIVMKKIHKELYERYGLITELWEHFGNVSNPHNLIRERF